MKSMPWLRQSVVNHPDQRLTKPNVSGLVERPLDWWLDHQGAVVPVEPREPDELSPPPPPDGS